MGGDEEACRFQSKALGGLPAADKHTLEQFRELNEEGEFCEYFKQQAEINHINITVLP